MTYGGRETELKGITVYGSRGARGQVHGTSFPRGCWCHEPGTL